MPTRAICGICRESLLFDERRIDALITCGHVFHHACIVHVQNARCPCCRSQIRELSGALRRIFVTLEDTEMNENGRCNHVASHDEMVTLFQQLRLQLDAAVDALETMHPNQSGRGSARGSGTVPIRRPISTPAPAPVPASVPAPANGSNETLNNITSRNMRQEQVINVQLPHHFSNRGQSRLHFEVRNGQLMIRISRR